MQLDEFLDEVKKVHGLRVEDNHIKPVDIKEANEPVKVVEQDDLFRMVANDKYVDVYKEKIESILEDEIDERATIHYGVESKMWNEDFGYYIKDDIRRLFTHRLQ